MPRDIGDPVMPLRHQSPHGTDQASNGSIAPQPGGAMVADQVPSSLSSVSLAIQPDVGDQAERRLCERARRWATAPAQARPGAEVDVLLCRLREEHYAIEARLLRVVHRGTGMTPVPCTPPHIAGMLTIRGEVVIVLDLA